MCLQSPARVALIAQPGGSDAAKQMFPANLTWPGLSCHAASQAAPAQGQSQHCCIATHVGTASNKTLSGSGVGSQNDPLPPHLTAAAFLTQWAAPQWRRTQSTLPSSACQAVSAPCHPTWSAQPSLPSQAAPQQGQPLRCAAGPEPVPGLESSAGVRERRSAAQVGPPARRLHPGALRFVLCCAGPVDGTASCAAGVFLLQTTSVAS